MFDFLDQDDFSPGVAPPANYAFTVSSPHKQKAKKGGTKARNRESRRRAAVELADLSHQEAEYLHATQGIEPSRLPPHLRVFGLQRRNASCFSGPGVLPNEEEIGSVEYKLRLLDPTPSRFHQLVTQLNWRLSEGCGQCLYALGVEDNGHPRGLDEADLDASLAVLHAMAAEVGAVAEVLQTPPGTEGRLCAAVRVVRSSTPALDYADLRVAVAGGVDSGKSTLVGVLSHGTGGAPLLDNGRGSSRVKVLQHKHEIESGHTSSISEQMLAYDAAGCVLNYSGLSSLTPAEVAGSAARMLRFFDLGGHEKFSKTALHGLTCLLPDYVMLCVSAVTGVSWVTREHLSVSIALGIPFCVAVTKCDLAGEAGVQLVADEIRGLLAAAVQQGGGSVANPMALAPLVQSEGQAVQLAASMYRSRIAAPGASLCVPLFATSSVSGASLQLLHSFLNALQPGASGSDASEAAGAAASEAGMQGWRQLAVAGTAGTSCAAGEVDSSQAGASGARQLPAHFQIDGSFEVADVGSVYSGTVVSGSVRIGDELLLGPLEGGSFRPVRISGIHRSKVDVRSAQQGQHATVAVHHLEPEGTSLSGAAAAKSSSGSTSNTGGAAAAAGAGAGKRQQLPSRADSAGCLHAWMQQSGGGTAAQAATTLQGQQPAADELAGGANAARAGPSSRHPTLPRCTPALAIQPLAGAQAAGHTIASSCSAAQLDGSQRRHQQALEQQQAQQGASGAEAAAAAGELQLPRNWSSSPQLAPAASSGPAPRPRKGAVLLDPSLHPQACTQFEAVLVLLGGHWPARGLLSGCYPPEGGLDEPDTALASAPSGRSLDWAAALGSSADGGCDGLGGGSLGTRSQSLGNKQLQRSQSRRRSMAYIPVVHCGSIRQAAQVVAMRELPLPACCGGGSEGAAAGSGGDTGDEDEEEEEDALSLLLGCELSAEPSGGGGSLAVVGAARRGVHAGHAARLDMCQLAGAVAAAGVLLPQPRLASTSSSSCQASSTASGSSGNASGGEGAGPAAAGARAAAAAAAATAAAAAGGGADIPGGQLAAALERQRLLLTAGDDIGCMAAVTFSFMHQPEWLVEGARLIFRDRTTGRTAGAGYVTAVGAAAAVPSQPAG